jgi:hypothetical protein
MIDILLDDTDDINFINGDFDLGESEIQEVAIILRLQQGALKSDVITGSNLTDFIKGKMDPTSVEKRVKVQLERDGKNYDTIKQTLKIKTYNGQ